MNLALEEVTVRLERATALENVNVRLERGAHVGVCGGPGSGKTILLKVLAGLVRPTSGRVLWNGEDVWALSPGDRRERQAAFGMVFQSDALFDSDTVLSNVEQPLIRRKVPKDQADARAREAISRVGLEGSELLLPEQLSGGMRKRAGIARAIAARPQVLLADDPLAGLDPSTAQQIGTLLLRETSEERTLIAALPDPVSQLPLPRWIRLDFGRVTYDGKYDERRLERGG